MSFIGKSQRARSLQGGTEVQNDPDAIRDKDLLSACQSVLDELLRSMGKQDISLKDSVVFLLDETSPKNVKTKKRSPGALKRKDENKRACDFHRFMEDFAVSLSQDKIASRDDVVVFIRHRFDEHRYFALRLASSKQDILDFSNRRFECGDNNIEILVRQFGVWLLMGCRYP
ncbi:hypothetical protein Pla110_18340 [Polystyrenella longa]|uniref:Uncharacterized protein n=1 Tax=Polystyrenella longa TaxID=2528007 RepID=A0A518CLK4_9PLAN|nr:hypothetical protein [Polystyrenella longa]QDU80112.1 hypothetical protein Pla110_18340 [Polystyrenella longa]